MRLHRDTSGTYLHALSTAMKRDAFSLDAWKCLHIHPLDQTPVDTRALEVLKASNNDADCDIVLCPDGDLLLISRSMNYEAMHTLGATLCAPLELAPEAAFYDMFRDAATLHALLAAKIPAHQPQLTAPMPPHARGPLSAVCTMHIDVQKKRIAREPLHIMIVEDDAMTRRIVANSFKQHFALIAAETAEQALDNYLLHAPDIVFLDIGLPDANGFDVLQQIVAHDPQAFVVMFSGSSYLENITSALGQGAAGFVGKPFKPETLHHYVRASINQRATIQG